MPKKVQPESSTKEKSIRLPNNAHLASLMKQSLNYDSQIKRPTAERGELIADYKQNKHVDPPAFNIVKAMFKLSDDKLKTRLAHLRHYLDNAVDAQGKTLDDRAGGATLEMFEDPPRQKDEDNVTDMRPRHLRQPGASGADIEKAEREAGNDPTTPLKH